MKITYPHVIENSIGEKIIFHELLNEPDGDRLVGENYVAPGVGPVMHTHLLQDESLTVITGKLGYEIQGQPLQYAGEGETVIFKRGVPHRFWNDGQEVLHCTAWLKPANTAAFYLTTIFNAQKKSGNARPEKFDAAYLLTRYAAEYEIAGIPLFVKKIIIPATYYIGKLLGKYKHFKDAPEPVRS